MFYPLLFSRIIQEQIPSSLPSPPSLTIQGKSCATHYITFKESPQQFILYPQYQVNDSVWQDDTLFNNLMPDTLYKFTARYRSYQASSESDEYIFNCTDYHSYIDIDPPIIEIVEKNDTSIKLNAIQPITVNISLEYQKNGEWHDSSTFTGLGYAEYHFTSRYRSIETPDDGPPRYIRTLQRQNINYNKVHILRHYNLELKL